MALKKEVIKKEIKGDMSFLGSDALMVRMNMDADPMVMSKRCVDFAPGVLPGDFDREKYEVSGKFRFDIEIKEK